MLARTLLACLPIVIPTVAAAQSGGTAHLYTYRIKDRAAFEAGYRQHLRWHARHADKLAWFAWYVTSGDRAGSFVDGTFGTTPDGLAGRPDPEGDGADFRANAGPYVSAGGDEGWELWREASQATPLEQRRPGTYLHVYAIAADNKAAFEAAIATRPLHGATWYRGLDGASDHYLLMLPARSPGAPPPVSLGSQVRTLRAETWQYAPRLALMPGGAAGPLIARGEWRPIAIGPLFRSDPSMRFLPLALLLVATPALAQDLTPAETTKVDSIVTDTLARNGVPSASIAIVRGGKIVFAKAYGKQSEAMTTPRSDAPYQIASISKQFTAAAILLLEDEGKLSLDDTVAKWVPGITDGDKITIRQLLSHTSGLQDYWPQDYSFAAMEKPVTPQQIVDRWAKKPLDFAPGTQWQYSNTGYVVAGMIVEKAAGKPLLVYLQDKVFKPLAMKVIDQDLAVGKGFPQGYHRYALGPVRVEKPAARGWLFAAGELAMSASDLAKWDIARLNRSVLPADDWQVQETPILLTNGKSTNYGLGVFASTAKGHRYVEHTGEAVGFLSENIVFPDDKAAVVVLVNSDFSDAFTGIASQISELILPPATGAATPGDAETAKTAQARAIFDQLRAGKLDRATMTDDANYYFNATAIGDYRDSLIKLGDPASFTLARPARLRGGFVNRNYIVTYADGTKLSVVTYAEPDGTGRYEQFIVMPAE